MLLASPPEWVDDPNAYQYTAIMNAYIVLHGESFSEEGDILAAFDPNGNVRGTSEGSQIDPGFGDYNGIFLHEIMIRSNVPSDIITFKYYDASADVIYDIQESYVFVINDLVGNLIDPHLLIAMRDIMAKDETAPRLAVSGGAGGGGGGGGSTQNGGGTADPGENGVAGAAETRCVVENAGVAGGAGGAGNSNSTAVSGAGGGGAGGNGGGVIIITTTASLGTVTASGGSGGVQGGGGGGAGANGGAGAAGKIVHLLI